MTHSQDDKKSNSHRTRSGNVPSDSLHEGHKRLTELSRAKIASTRRNRRITLAPVRLPPEVKDE